MKLIPLIFVALLLGGCAVVDTGYRGVVTNWGKPTGEVKTEGISFLMPFSGFNVHPISVQTQGDKFEASAASRDLQTVEVEGVVNYHVDPAPQNIVDLYDKMRDDYQTRVLTPTISEAVKASTARFVASDLIAHRNEVVTAVDQSLRQQMTPYHIVVEQVLITNFKFNNQFQQAVEDKAAAQQALLTAQIEAQKAKAVAVGAAEAQAAQRTTLTPALLEKILLDKWDGHLPTYMTNSSGSPFTLLNIGGHHD